MRKLMFIVLGIVGYLLFAINGEGPEQTDVHPAAVIAMDHASSEQWLCERSHNSDLSLPRTVGEVSPSPVERVSFRGGHSDEARSLSRAVFQERTAGILKTSSVTEFLFPSAVVRAVDYYVYRLRRLII